MPAFIYRWWYGAHGLRNLQRSILGLVGIAPIRATLFGGVADGRAAVRWLRTMRHLGRRAG